MRELVLHFDEIEIVLLQSQADACGMTISELVASRLREKIAERRRRAGMRRTSKALPKNVILFRKKRVPKKVREEK
jgi:hypothetical protein